MRNGERFVFWSERNDGEQDMTRWRFLLNGVVFVLAWVCLPVLLWFDKSSDRG